MSDALLLLTSYAVNAVWQVAVLGAVGWGISRLVRRTGPDLQHKVWVATLIVATLAPATPILQSYFVPSTEASMSWPANFAPLAGRDVSQAGSDIVFQPIAINLVSGLYIAVLLFFSLRLCRAIRCTFALVRNAVPAMESEYASLRSSLTGAALLCSNDVPGPVTAGLLRPVVLFPAGFIENYSRSEFLAAAGHECAHVMRNDFRKNLLYEVAGLLTAFHPMTWFIKSQIAQTREMVCDRIAAEQFPNRRDYARSLLQLAGKVPLAPPPATSHAVGMFDTNTLERRIMTLTTSQPPTNRVRGYLSGISAIAILAIGAGVTASLTRSVSAQTNPTPQSSKDLSCTYWDRGKAHPGTCGFDKTDKTKYRCYLNENQSQPQIGCEWKVQRALGSQK